MRKGGSYWNLSYNAPPSGGPNKTPTLQNTSRIPWRWYRVHQTGYTCPLQHSMYFQLHAHCCTYLCTTSTLRPILFCVTTMPRKMGEKRRNRVGRKPGFGELNQEGLLEECVHHGGATKGLKGLRWQKRRFKTTKRLSSWDISIMLRALDATESRNDRCDAGSPARTGDQYYSIEIWMRALLKNKNNRNNS